LRYLDKAHALYIGLLAEEIKNDIYLEEIKNEELRKNELVLAKEIEKLEEIRSRKQKIIEQEVHKEKKSNIPSIFEEMDKQKEKELQSKRQEEIDKQKEEELKAQGIRIDPRFKSPQPILKKY
jgi:Mg-chelatase subunit ChlI